MSEVTTRLKEVQNRIEAARMRSPYHQDVTLVAVTKFHPVSEMKEVIAQASALRTENFVVYPVNKRDKETNWKKCYNLKAEFVITKNVTAKRGDRVIYLRLKRPDDKVIAFSEKSFFKYQNVSLTYSAKREINYEGDRLEMAIYWPNDGSLVKGKYVAELFSDNELIGSTEFTLN